LTTLNDNITIHEIKTRQIYLLFFLWEIEFVKGAIPAAFHTNFPLFFLYALAGLKRIF
jgi:hypothetical protein